MKRIRINSPHLEIELETDNLEDDLRIVMSLLDKLPISSEASVHAKLETKSKSSSDEIQRSVNSNISQGINSYIAKLGASSAREIMRVASYHISLNDNKDEFTKEELYARCKQVRDWKADYSNQQALNLHRMVAAGELTEKAGGLYCVPSRKLEDVKGRLTND